MLKYYQQSLSKLADSATKEEKNPIKIKCEKYFKVLFLF